MQSHCRNFAALVKRRLTCSACNNAAQEEDQFNFCFQYTWPKPLPSTKDWSCPQFWARHTSKSKLVFGNCQNFRSSANVESSVAANSLVPLQPQDCEGLCAHPNSCLFRCRLTRDLNSGLQKTLKALS